MADHDYQIPVIKADIFNLQKAIDSLVPAFVNKSLGTERSKGTHLPIYLTMKLFNNWSTG